MKRRTVGHTETTISGDTRADWSEAFALVSSLEVVYVWHASSLPPIQIIPELVDFFVDCRGAYMEARLIRDKRLRSHARGSR